MVGGGQRAFTAKSTQASLDVCMDVCMSSPGHRMMASLGISQARSPAEGLQPSQGNQSAHRMGNDWICATWNVRSMVDTEGSVAVAS